MDEVNPSAQGETNRTGKTLIVGVGASAAAMPSIERFMSRFTPDPVHATVLVLQHRESLDEERLKQVVTRSNGARIAVPHDGNDIAGGTVYLCAADAITTISGGRFSVRPAQLPCRRRKR